jgi:D-galactarolactone cycloisomerase
LRSYGIDEHARLIQAVRAAIGPSTHPMLDANRGFERVESLDIGWFMEPVVPDDPNSYVEVRRGQPIPVAGGECEFTR